MGGLEMVVWVVVMYLMAHVGTRVCLDCGAVRGLVFFLAWRLVSRGSVCVYPSCCIAPRPCLSSRDGFPLPGGVGRAGWRPFFLDMRLDCCIDVSLFLSNDFLIFVVFVRTPTPGGLLFAELAEHG